MEPTRRQQTRWWVLFGGAVLALATNGCSSLIASGGVSGANEIYKPETRAAVRAAFGAADETGTCPNGRVVEHRWIRQQIPWGCTNPKDVNCRQMVMAYLQTFGLIDLFVIPVVAVESEQAKLHYAFVYGEDDRVLYRYDLKAVPALQYEQARNRMAYRLLTQLNQGGCPAWSACLQTYAEEVRGLAACVGHPLTPVDEGILQRVQALAADVEVGRLSLENALADLRPCLWGRDLPDTCLRRAPSGVALNPPCAPSPEE